MSVSSADSRRVASRYATALFELASQKKKIDAVQSDLTALVGALGESDELSRLVESPVLSRTEQVGAMDAVLASAKADKLTRDFIRTLAENRRLNTLRDVAAKFTALVAESRNEVVAHVTTAHELTAKQVKELQKSLEKSTGRAAVTIETKVDPSIMGGVVIRLEGKMYDDSIASKLSRLSKVMKQQIAV